MKSNQIKQTFESIQADSNLADRVLNTAAGEPLHRKGHAKPLYVAVIGCLVGVLATGGVATQLSIPAILPQLGETTATGIPLPGPTAAHRELNIPTPESLAMASRPKAWKAQSRRLICPSRATAIRLISMRWQSTKTAAEP